MILAQHGVGLYLELPTIFVAAFFGAAYFAVRRVTVLAAFVLALIIGLGGGIWRDIILNIEPAAFQYWYFVPVALLGGTVGVLVRDRIDSIKPIPYVRNLATAMLLLIGLEKAYSYDNPILSVVLIGMITAIAGTVSASLLSRNDLFHHNGGAFTTLCLLVASVVFLAAAATGRIYLAEVATLLSFVAMRHWGHKRGWTVPQLPWEPAIPETPSGASGPAN